jgi:hypothetical protein
MVRLGQQLLQVQHTGRDDLGSCGTQTAALGFGGRTPTVTNVTEEYNGTAWTGGGNMNTTRM